MHSGKRLYEIVAVLILIFGSGRTVFADGCFIPMEVQQVGNSALSPNQRAVVIHDGENETLIVQVKYSGNIRDFAWVIPLPALPEAKDVQTESDSIFTLLHDMSQPKVFVVGNGRWGGGGGGDLTVPENGVEEINKAAQVWRNLSVGPYEIHIISGGSGQAVRDWLNVHGYAYDASTESVLDFYVRKRWYFLAAKVWIEEEENGTQSAYQAGLPALKVSFLADQPVFPLRISALSSANQNEIEIYVAAQHRMISDTYPTFAMNPDEVEAQIKAQVDAQTTGAGSGLACACRRLTGPTQYGPPTYDYEAIFREKLASLPSGSLIMEYSGSHYIPSENDYWAGSFGGFFDPYFPDQYFFILTRLRTVFGPDQMIDDVTFVPDPEGDDWLLLHMYLDEKSHNPWRTAGLGFPLLFFIPLIFNKAFRKRYASRMALLVIALYLILL